MFKQVTRLTWVNSVNNYNLIFYLQHQVKPMHWKKRQPLKTGEDFLIKAFGGYIGRI